MASHSLCDYIDRRGTSTRKESTMYDIGSAAKACTLPVASMKWFGVMNRQETAVLRRLKTERIGPFVLGTTNREMQRLLEHMCHSTGALVFRGVPQGGRDSRGHNEEWFAVVLPLYGSSGQVYFYRVPNEIQNQLPQDISKEVLDVLKVGSEDGPSDFSWLAVPFQ